MVAAAKPANEDARLAALAAYGVLDTEPEPIFDDLAALAAQICRTPIALLCLIDADRQWFKSRRGLDATETPRDVAMCAHTILTPNRPLVVPDTQHDARFSDNPLVIGAPHMRSYAGVALVDHDGHALGTLCAIDTVPRDLSADQLVGLASLARQAVTLLELRRKVREARALARDGESFFDRSLDLMCVAGVDGLFKRVNAAFVFTLDYSVDELVGTSFFSFIHPDDVATTSLEVDKLAAGALTIDFENRYRCRDGTYRLLSWRTVPDPETGLLYAIARDLTDARAAEQANRDLTAQLIEAAPSAMILVDDRGVIRLVNQATERVFGYAREELVGESVHLLLPAELRSRHRRRIEAFAASPRKAAPGAGRPLFGQHKDGSQVPVEIRLNPLQTAAGPAVLASIVDVSERVANKRYLQTQLRVLGLTAANDPFDATIEEIIALVASSMGWNAGEFWLVDAAEQRLRATAFWSDVPRPLFAAATHDAAMASGVGIPGTVWATAKPLWVPDIKTCHGYRRSAIAASDGIGAGVGFPVLSNDVVIGVLAFFSDQVQPNDAQVVDTMGTVTGAIGQYLQRKQAEAATLKAQEAAETANETKSAFLANMGHEIRTPMNAVIGLTHLALRTQLDEQQRDYLDKIAQSARSLLGIINDLLDFSKIEAGHLQLEIAPFSLDSLLDGLSSSVSAQAEQRGIELIFNVASDLPDELIGDHLRLLQVLTNLCSNAIKFTEQGEVVVRLSVVTQGDEQVRVRFSVRDTGIGLDPDRAARLFEPFNQADVSTSRKHGGTGLGLSICKRLVGLMGGTIEVDSAIGLGSTFAFEIELDVAEDNDHATVLSLPAGMRALVVDDNASARQVFAEMLAAWRLEVSVAASGAEAIAAITRAAAEGAPVNLVVLDWQMPGMNGLEVANRIRETLDPTVSPTVVMATAYRDAEMTQQAAEAGVRGVLAKPVNPATLFNTVLAALHALPVPVAHTFDPHALEARWRQRLQGAKVLLAEDNATNQQIAIELLQNVGIEVVVASNGMEVLARIDIDVDAVLMDLQMPGMDGITATERMLARPEVAHIPIIAMTANAMAQDRARVQAAGMKGFVAKPVEPAALYATLALHLPALTERASSRGPRRLPGATTTAPTQIWQSSSDTFAHVRLPNTIEGIELDGARRRLAGNDKLLAKLLARFVEQQADVSVRIAAQDAAGDNQSAVREAHTLKGLAGNLGMTAIAALAAKIEAALVERQPIEALVAALSVAVADTVRRLAPIVAQSPIQAPSAVAAIDVAAELAQLIELLASEDTAAQGAVERLLRAVPGGALRLGLQQAQVQLAAYDFDAARAVLDDAMAGDDDV